MHPDRRKHTEAINRLATDGQWEEVYRRIMLEEFGHEARMGWQLAFLRPFCAPRMARILVASGNIVQQPLKRAYDTGLIIYEIVYNGLDSPAGRKMVSLMNRAHHGRSIVDEDMTYVLCAFIVAPYRYMSWTGWRRLTDIDRQASLEFYRRMGRLMNIKTMPGSYQEAEQILDDYEARYVVPNDDARLLGENLIKVLKGRLPGPAKPIATPLFTAFIDDARISRALGYTPLPRPAQAVVRGLGRLYGLVQAQLPYETKPVFTPGNKAGKAYPHGYTLDDLGPDGIPDEATLTPQSQTETHEPDPTAR